MSSNPPQWSEVTAASQTPPAERHSILAGVAAALTGTFVFILVALLLDFARSLASDFYGPSNFGQFPLGLVALAVGALVGFWVSLKLRRWLARKTLGANWWAVGLSSLPWALIGMLLFSFQRLGVPAGQSSLPNASVEAPGPAKGVGTARIPRFPWPPPAASSSAVIKIRKPAGVTAPTLGDIDEVISSTLSAAGYVEKAYFEVPDGFALVTRLEQIYPNGRPKERDQRWAPTVGPLTEFSIEAFLRALFTANPGFFRVIVFVVTSNPFPQSDQTVARDAAVDWLRQGLNTLPTPVADMSYTKQHNCTALVYEFEQTGSSKPADLKVPGRLTVRTHLQRTALLPSLEH